MPKQINLTNIKINSLSVIKTQDKYQVNVNYDLLDENGKTWDTKGFIILDLTNSQKAKLDSILHLITTKIKNKEQI